MVLVGGDDGDGVRRASRCIVCDGRGLCLVCASLVVRGLGYKINSINTGLFSIPKSPNDSFGVNLRQWCENRRVGEFCNSLTEVPCC